MAIPRVEVTVEDVHALAGLAGLAVPEEDLEPLAGALADQLAAAAELAALDLEGVEQAERFDPRWA